MIHLCNVSKSEKSGKNKLQHVLKNVTVSFPRNARIALVGGDAQALTTVLHLLAGSEVPDEGRVIAERLRRSPIINAEGVAGGSLMKRLSGLENVNFFARINGVDPGHLLAVVESACRLDRLLRAPVLEYESPMRRALEIALVASLPYECYFLDRLDKLEKPLIWQLIHAARRRGAGLFFATKKLPKFGQAGAIVERGTIRIFRRTKEAVTDNAQRRQQGRR